MSKADLRLDWCSYQAAKYAVEHWHYSRSMPTPPVVKIGVWERESFIGAVLFSRGANNNLGKPYGLQVTEICELTRVALDNHQVPVSRIISVATRMMVKVAPGLRLVVSFADTNEGHHGGIYQAAGWVYSGQSHSTPKYYFQGKKLEQRQVSRTGVKRQYGNLRRVPTPDDCSVVPQLDKYRYLYPLDPAMRAQIALLAKPYPKRVRSADSGTAGDQPASGGATPTRTLLDDEPAQATGGAPELVTDG